jgi:RHS repeat-associated protein
MEKDDEVKGSGNSYDFGARLHDPRIARFLTRDPLEHRFNYQSTYVFAGNNPIKFIDYNGEGIQSTDVRRNKDGTYTVVGAKADGDVNVYLVDDKGKRTGKIVAQTLSSFDFMTTNNKTGEFTFKHSKPITFDLKNIDVSGTVRVNEHEKREIFDADFSQLVDWVADIFAEESKRLGKQLNFERGLLLEKMSKNGKCLDIKASMGLNEYTPVLVAKGAVTKITTLRAVGNFAFGANLKTCGTPLMSDLDFYKLMMKNYIGPYNQSANKGNGYNKGWPYYGEHSYSGWYIYNGFFRQNF